MQFINRFSIKIRYSNFALLCRYSTSQMFILITKLRNDTTQKIETKSIPMVAYIQRDIFLNLQTKQCKKIKTCKFKTVYFFSHSATPIEKNNSVKSKSPRFQIEKLVCLYFNLVFNYMCKWKLKNWKHQNFKTYQPL